MPLLRSGLAFALVLTGGMVLQPPGSASAQRRVLQPPGGASAERRAVPPELRIVDWNICGEAGGDRGKDGYCAYRNDPDAKVEQIKQLVDRHQANVVTLQEVCGDDPSSHLGKLQALLGSGWSIKRADQHRESDGDSDCRNKLRGTLGVAIAVKGTITKTTAKNMLPPGPDGQALPLLCVRVAGWTSRICTTHVLAHSEGDTDTRRRKQIENTRAAVAADRPNVVLTGDFNLFPDSADLQPIRQGFSECDGRAYGSGDKTNEATHFNGHGAYTKRDHIFAGSRRFTFCDADQSRMDTTPNVPQGGPPNGWSDHAPLIGYLRTAPAPAAPADLNGDGRSDLLTVDDAGKLRLYGGDGNGGVAGSPDIIGDGGWSGSSITHRGDYTAEGYADVVARVGGELRIYPSNGFGSLGSPVKAANLPTDARVLSVGDLTGDGRPDIAAGYDDKLYLYAGDPARVTLLKPPVLIGNSGWDRMTLAAPGDTDHDGRPDLLTRDTGNGTLRLYPGQADGTFGEPTTFGSGWTTTNRPLLASGGAADLWATTKDGKLCFYASVTGACSAVVGNSGWDTIKAIS